MNRRERRAEHRTARRDYSKVVQQQRLLDAEMIKRKKRTLMRRFGNPTVRLVHFREWIAAENIKRGHES